MKKPDLTIISAGFDAARGDPLGGCDITPEGYAHLTKQLMEVTPDGKVLLVLEGGYNLESISTSFAACVRVLKVSEFG
jgi:acetoin utilization deacetylase AcuC-like enzyme